MTPRPDLPSERGGRNRLSFRSKLLLLTIGIIAVFIPLEFWRGVWFGSRLSEEDLREALAEPAPERRIQHALTQLEEEIRRGGSGAARWYPQIIALGRHPRLEIRLQVAWVLGQDNQSPEFQRALNGLLQDPHALVRRNAALGLARFNDLQALPHLRAMLQSYPLRAPQKGRIQELSVKLSEWLQRDQLVARLQTDSGSREITVPLSGRVMEVPVVAGMEVDQGSLLLRLEPQLEHVWEALRALYLIGGESELALVESYQDNPRYSSQLRQQAANTAARISSRLRH